MIRKSFGGLRRVRRTATFRIIVPRLSLVGAVVLSSLFSAYPTLAAQSDLILQNLAVNPTSGPAGSGATVSFTIRNQGGGPANASTTNIRITTSSTNVTPGDTPLALGISVPAIPAGGTFNVNRAVTIPSLTPGVYFIWVIADVNSTANQSNEANDYALTSFIVPAAPLTGPTGLVAVGSGNTVLLQWVDNSSAETGFKIERRVGLAGGYSLLTQVGTNATTYQDSGLAAGSTYCYRVAAYNASTTSGYSNEACGTALATPVLSAPADGATLAANAVTLQ